MSIKRIYEPFAAVSNITTDPDGDANVQRITGAHAWTLDAAGTTTVATNIGKFGGVRFTTATSAQFQLGLPGSLFNFASDRVDRMRWKVSFLATANVICHFGLSRTLDDSPSAPALGWKFVVSADTSPVALAVDGFTNLTEIDTAPALVAGEIVEYELARQTPGVGVASPWIASIRLPGESRRRFLGSFAASEVPDGSVASNDMRLGCYIEAAASSVSVDLHEVEVLSQQL